ncbi:MAG: hypothetical protein ACPG5W_04420, partial [Flavobacteriales bacterium]
GGSNYTMKIYEVVKGELRYIGEVSACTAAHMGEDSEVWKEILRVKPRLRKTIENRIKKSIANGYKWPNMAEHALLNIKTSNDYTSDYKSLANVELKGI